jgi:two-component system, OmpR family, response regulator VicR
MTDQLKVLLLEDDPNLGLIIQESLVHLGYAVTLLPDGEAGLAEFQRSQFDLCLVDVMMPLKDGFSFAREIRRTDVDTPLIFLTAKSLTEDKVAGFKIGCDDYITKPFSMEELVLRIQAVLRRRGGAGHHLASDTFAIGKFQFEYSRQVLSIDDEEVPLTSRESELLRLLCLHKNKTLERSSALRTIWGDDSYHAGRSMDVFISKLRKHLKRDTKIEIKTIHGQGFRLLD